MKESQDWDDLKFFLAVSREGSLAGAARALGVAHSTVHRRVQRMEASMGGVRLFESLSSGYVLTALGEQARAYAERVEEEVDALDAALRGVDQRLSGEVSLTTTASLSECILGEHMMAFHEAYPNIELRLKVDARFLSLARREADIALRPARRGEDIAVGRRVLEMEWGVFATRDYLARTGRDEGTPLREHGVVTASGDTANLPAWRWLMARVNRSQVVASAEGVIHTRRLMLSGLGIAALPWHTVVDREEVRCLARVIEPASGELWLLTHQDLRRSARIRAALEFFYDSLRQDAEKFMAPPAAGEEG